MIQPSYNPGVNGNALISGRVSVGVLLLVGIHLVADRSPETLAMILYWGSFVVVGLFVGVSSSLAFARGLVTSLLGCLGSWAVSTQVFKQVSDEREIFIVFVFLLPLTSLLAGASASLGSWASRKKNRFL